MGIGRLLGRAAQNAAIRRATDEYVRHVEEVIGRHERMHQRRADVGLVASAHHGAWTLAKRFVRTIPYAEEVALKGELMSYTVQRTGIARERLEQELTKY